ncbi:MAG: hypothetical protein ACFE8L_02630 [Candidatus Hodarchaeota archaeon]
MIILYNLRDWLKSSSSINPAAEYKNSPASKYSPEKAISFEKFIEEETIFLIDLILSTGSLILLIFDSDFLSFSKKSE